MSYEIPKEIKAKPKIIGLEVKEIVVLMVSVFLIFTVFKNMVHKMFMIPYFLVSFGAIFYMIAPSTHNPDKKNYHTLILLFRRDNHTYHPIDVHKVENEELYLVIKKKNKDIVPAMPVSVINETTTDDVDGVEVLAMEKDVGVEKSVPFIENEVLTDEPVENDFSETKNVESEKVEDDAVEVPQNSKQIIDRLHIVKAKEDLNMNERQNEQTMSQSRTSRNVKKKRRKINVKKLLLVSAIVFVVGGGSIIGSFFYVENGYTFFGKAPEVIVNDEEIVMKALRSASLQKYDDAVTYFDEIDYELLEEDDKDVMLLSYLFTDQAEISLKLEPNFDETVVSFYKATDNFKVLRNLNEKVKSEVIEFEIAVVDRDYNSIISLSEKVKLKDERSFLIIEAYLKTDNVDGAIEFAEQRDSQELLDEIEKYQEKIKNEEEQDNAKDSKKEKKKESDKNVERRKQKEKG